MLPPTTKLPNASTTWPASPSSRIRRVTDTLIARRKSVVSSRIVGNDEKSSARGTYIVATTIISAAEMFSVMKKSSSSGGSGMISIATIRTTPPAASEVSLAADLGHHRVHAAPPEAGDAVDVGEELRHGVEHVLGDLTPDVDVGVQRARQRRVGDDHDAGVLGGFTDLVSEIVDSLGDDRGCVAARLVLEGDGVVGGVGHDHVCGGNCIHHARAGHLHRPSALMRFHFGRKLLLLELLFEFFLVHLQTLLVLVPLPGVIQGGEREVGHRRACGDRHHQRGDLGDDVGGRRADERGELIQLGEDRHRGDHADRGGLGDVLEGLDREVLRVEEVLEA